MAKQLTGRQRSEAKRQIVITNPSVCYYCKSTGLTETDKFCPNCAFPQRGGQTMMKKFIWNINNKHTLLADQKKAINKARNMLFGLSILFTLFSILLGVVTEFNLVVLLTNLVVAGIYLGLGLWSRKNPFPAILTGFFLYITLIVINAVIDSGTIFQGLFMKGFVIAGFVYGYKGVKDSVILEKELESIKKAKDLTVSNEVSEMSN
jgi:hypothetical protein